MNRFRIRHLMRKELFMEVKGILVKDCTFDGPADGESAFKESSDMKWNSAFSICGIRSGMIMACQSEARK